MTVTAPFHLAFPVTDLEETRRFYQDVLGCSLGRSDSHWIDFNLFGHQIVAHQVETMPEPAFNPVDSEQVPVPHFGVVLSMDKWRALVDRLGASGVQFEIEPTIRFQGTPGEQATCFFRDPCGNALEFKAFADPDNLFQPFAE
ncbi:MAG: VOC family protein [Gammaproteobacteria bacterium]